MPSDLAATLFLNTGEFTDENGVPNWSRLTDPSNRAGNGRGGINPLRAAMKYNRGDNSSIAQFDKPFYRDNVRSRDTMHQRLDKIIEFANAQCGNPLSDSEVARFADDMRAEMADILMGRREPRSMKDNSANRNRINAEATNAKVIEFRRELERAKTPEEILRVFKPILEFRARLERVRRELIKRRTNISKAAFQLTEYSMSNTVRMYHTDPDAIFVEAIGVWNAPESGIGFGRDVDMAHAKRISMIFPRTKNEPEDLQKLRGEMFLAANGVSDKFQLHRTRWGEYEKAVTRGMFQGEFGEGDWWVDVRFTRRKDGKRDELDDIVDEFSPVGPDYHGKVKLLPEYENVNREIRGELGSIPSMEEEAFPTEGSAEAVDVLLRVMQKFGMNVTIARRRLEMGMRRTNTSSIVRNTFEEKTTERFMNYLYALADYMLVTEYRKRKSTTLERKVLEFQASAVAQMVCMQVGFNLAALSANRSVQKLFRSGLFNEDENSVTPTKNKEAADALVISSDIASEITAALLDTLKRRRRAKHENFD